MRLLYQENDFQLNEEVEFKLSKEDKGIISAIRLRPHANGGLEWAYEVTYWNGNSPSETWCTHHDIIKIKKPTPPKAE